MENNYHDEPIKLNALIEYSSVFLVILLIVLFQLVIPKFESMFIEMNVSLPPLTNSFIWLSHHSLFLYTLPILLGCVIFQWRKHEKEIWLHRLRNITAIAGIVVIILVVFGMFNPFQTG